MNTHHITLNDQELVVLNEALIGLPYKVVAPVIHSIARQLAETQNGSDQAAELEISEIVDQ
jgi:hypothetical protein